MPLQPVLELLLGDVVRLRRAHPCGGDTWLIDRLGADIGLRCQTCGRHVLLERPTLERRLAGFEARGDPAVTAAVSRRDRSGRWRLTLALGMAAPATTTVRAGDVRRDGRRGRGARRRPRGLPQRRVPATVDVAGGDPDRRQHGPLRVDGHRRQLHELQHGCRIARSSRTWSRPCCSRPSPASTSIGSIVG